MKEPNQRSANNMSSRIITTREALVRDLLSYGEEEIAARIPGLPNSAYLRIEVRSMHYACISEKPNGPGMLLAKALSKAAVEVIEGGERELKWKKRKLKKPNHTAEPASPGRGGSS